MLMKLKLIVLAPLFLITIASFAQTNVDSVALAKADKQKATIETRLKERKDKLVQLEQQLVEKQSAKDKAASNAEQSAEENRRAAVQLSNDASHKRKARKADNASDDARKNAKRARIAASNLEDVEDDIKSLKKKIAEDESRLTELNAKSGN